MICCSCYLCRVNPKTVCPYVNGTVDFIWSCDVLTGAAHVSFVLVYSLKKKESYFLAVVLSGCLIYMQNNDVIHCHGIASDARVTSQWIVVLGTFNHTSSQIYAFLVEAAHAKSFLYRCQMSREFWTRKLSLEGHSIAFRGLLVICYFSVFL